MTPPRVVSQEAQPVTGSSSASLGLTINTAGALSYRAQYIVFAGELNHELVELEVLAGEGSPTPSAGYAKWLRIPRPQRKALTILEGYEPFVLNVPIMFDAVRGNGLQEDVEDKIQWLEWMAGRGIKRTKGFTPGLGKPPLVSVYSAIGNERAVPLIPKPFQTPNLKWFVEDIEWATKYPEVMRSRGGARIRQAATVKLVEYVVDPVLPQEPKEGASKTFKISSGYRSVRSLVAHHLVGSRSRLGEAVAATIKLNKGNRKIGTNPEKHLPVGTPIKIPSKYLQL